MDIMQILVLVGIILLLLMLFVLIMMITLTIMNMRRAKKEGGRDVEAERLYKELKKKYD